MHKIMVLAVLVVVSIVVAAPSAQAITEEMLIPSCFKYGGKDPAGAFLRDINIAMEGGAPDDWSDERILRAGCVQIDGDPTVNQVSGIIHLGWRLRFVYIFQDDERRLAYYARQVKKVLLERLGLDCGPITEEVANSYSEGKFDIFDEDDGVCYIVADTGISDGTSETGFVFEFFRNSVLRPEK